MTGVSIAADHTVQTANVVRVSLSRRDAGFMCFPCFELDQSLPHGMSGGGVFFKGELCGLLSAADGDGSSYAASLWPLLDLTFESELAGRTVPFSAYIESGEIEAPGWRRLQARIKKDEDEFTGTRKIYLSPETET